MKPVTIETKHKRQTEFIAQRPDANEVNEYLMRHGLGGLDDPNLIHQIAFLVKDHNHFAQIVRAISPAERTSAYDAMKPYLNFEPYPLDRYLIVVI
jgi:hypothetical protein